MIHKTYLSRAATRAMALDHPVGDPTGGAAYGERRDPISAIISVATMAGSYAAAGSFAAMTLTQGLMFAGGALGLVGNITGNKTISKLGMIAGIAGGVGMLAEGVMGQAIGGTMGETFGYGAGAVDTASAAAAPTIGNQAAGNVAEAAQMASSPVEAAMGPAPVDATQLATAPSGPAAQSLNAGPGAGAPSLNAGPGAAPLGGAPDPFTATTPTGLRALPGDTGALAPGFMDSLKAGNYMDALKAGGSNLMDLTKSNPGAALMMGNAVGGVADWLSGKSDAEIAALEAQTGYSNAAALKIQEEIAREKRRRANLNQSYGRIDTGIRVNTNASMLPGQNAPMPMPQGAPGAMQMQMPPQPGLIAGARPPGG